jgi:hypothetical protein
MESSANTISDPEVSSPMNDLNLARLIHADREREVARNLRVRAWREARDARGHDVFVPPPPDQRPRLSHALRLVPNLHHES